MSDIKINGQPVGRMVFNADNFKRLQAEVLELYELVTKLNAKALLSEKTSTSRKKSND